MKKIYFVLILSILITPLFSQAKVTAKVAPAAAEKEKSAPVRRTFGTSLLIDNHTVATPYKGGLELEIQHRFSLIEDYHDLYGIYGAANTRIGLNYGLTDKIMIGFGTTKDYQLQDLEWKYLILQQTEDKTVPVSVSYYGNIVADLRKEDNFGPADKYKTMHRLSYFNQIIVAQKLNDMFSIQIAPTMIYFNSVPRYSDSTGYMNLNFGMSAGLRANLFGSHSLIIEYDKLITKQQMAEQPKPNLSFGWEIGTGTHTFSIFAANYSQIIGQRNMVFNTNYFRKGGYLFGFNINVRF